MKTKVITCLLISLISLNFCYSQIVTLNSSFEFNAPSNNPWGLKYDGANLWISDSIGKIYKTSLTGVVLDSITVKNTSISGITFVNNDLWIVNTNILDDTIINTTTHGIYSLYKIDKSNGQKLDSIHVMGPASNSKSGFLWGLCYYKSNLYISYNGGWGPCLMEIDMGTKKYINLCCTHLCGMATINDSIWAIRNNSNESTGNYISIANSTLTGGYEKYKLSFYATDITYDGQYIWLLDKDSKKVKKMDLLLSLSKKTIHLTNENQIELFPNPAEDRITIKTKLTTTRLLNIDIIDVSGRLIKTIKNDSAIIDLKGIIPGIYFVNFKLDNDKRITKKIIVK